MLTPIRALWSVLSVSVSCTCALSFFQPTWFFHKSNHYTLGLFGYCSSNQGARQCYSYSTDVAVYDLATGVWQSACLLYAGGCILMSAGTILVLASLTVDSTRVHTCMCVAATYGQVVSVIMLTVSLIVHPLSLGAAFVTHFCGNTSAYVTDECQMGWAYMLAIMGTALSYFCPVLAYFKDFDVQTHSDSHSTRYAEIRSPTRSPFGKHRPMSETPILEKRPLSAVSHYDKIVSECHDFHRSFL